MIHLFKKAASFMLLACLAACGGGSETGAGPGGGSPSVTHVTGVVAKGPVAGATLCAYGIAGGTKGAQLGNCTTTNASGAYALDVPVAAGLVLLEATGGSYLDEATAVNTGLSQTMRSLVAASGTSATATVTPLTTLAVNAVLAGGPVTASGLASHVNAVLTAFALPATLDILAKAPDFATSGDVYAHSLAVISRMVADGTTLAAILGTTNPADLASAYAAAAAAIASEGSGAASATGSLTVAGGPNSTFTPQADGFEVSVNQDGVKYRFYRDNKTTQGGAEITLTAYLEVKVNLQGAIYSVVYNDPQTIMQAPVFCLTNCAAGISIETPAGASHPLTLRLNGVQLGTVTLNGSLTGDVNGALWRVQDLPRSTEGAVRLNGADQAITKARYTKTTVAGSTQHSAAITLSDGAIVNVDFTEGTASPVVTYQLGSSFGICLSNCPATVTSNSDGAVIALNDTPLSNGSVLGNSVVIAKTKGTLNTSTLGAFSPQQDKVSSVNGKTTYSFEVPGTAAQAGGMVSVTFEGGVAISATLNAGMSFYSCFKEAIPLFGAPACTGLSLGSDRRTVTFAGTTLANKLGSLTANGTLKAQGL